MKKRIFCTAMVLLLTAAVACTEADFQNIKSGSSEVIVLDTDNLPAPDIKKPNTEIENNTENGDKDTDSENKNDSLGNTEIADNTDSAETKGFPEDEKPSIDDYVIEECEGEYVLIKSAVVRSGPSTDFDKLGQLQADIVVEITGTTDNGWFQFEYDSVDGYINQKFFMDKETYDEEVASNESGEENQIEENNTEEHVESTLASQIVAICNEYRVAEGLEPLTEDPELDALAQIRAEEIVVYFEHERPDGSDCFTVMKDYKCTLCGENIAAGQGNPKEVVDAWMDSEGHRANIMNKDFKKIGIGYSAGGEFGAYWAQLFAD
ncbi:MAG: SH3 domain-containing protein [Lachnospiraceae bacterium]|nr:SH3 domain-containing protein [Lachnospiraceae bacterium]MBR5916955.1 SH3 domain-containing protein [Lachnospiraceae bacterium]